ncbi:uncharacterized protein [Porites lutea]|uniref:uncharacterized protein n=1 Tax=Porites lutea TaxID=51062 RepID=UPI003CC534F4
MKMKFAVFFIVMVCTTMYVCKAQDRSSNFWHKPAANIGAANKGDTAYSPNTVIEDWDVDSLNSYLADGMNYTDGKLVVPIGGVYFIYAQFYHLNGHAMNVNVNNKQRLRIQSPTHPHKHGTSYTGSVFHLNAGDVITMSTGPVTIKLYMQSTYSFFGAVFMGS